MSPQHCSLAYADEEEETLVVYDSLHQHKPTRTLMGRSKPEITAMEDIVEFGGTLVISF